MSHDALLLLFSVLMLPGLLGVIVPVIPGIPYMLLIAVVFGYIDHFEHLSVWELAALAAVAVASVVVDHLSGVLGAKYGGAGRRATVIGLVGMVLGLIVFPPFGGLVGLFIGVLAAEFSRHRDRGRAVKAATGSLIGSLAGIAINFVLALVFLASFIAFALR